MVPPKRALGVGALVIGVLVLIAPVSSFTADQYSAYAAGIQTMGLVLTLFLGYLTLRSELVDRRVDRTLDLHRELVSGEVGEARARLVQVTRLTHPPRPIDRKLLSRSALQGPPVAGSTASYEDVVALLRFFERVDATRRAGSLDNVVAASLIGSHACWWDRAILADDTKARKPLRSFAQWAMFVAEENSGDDRFHDWGVSTNRDWGPPAL